MIEFFGISIDTLTTILLVITAIIVVGVLLLVLANVLFFKIGVRNIARRRLQMVLIVFALMLSTTLISSVLATGDVMTSAVQTVAVYNWGSIDEIVQGGRGTLGTYPEAVYYAIQAHQKTATNVVAVGAALQETNLLLADETSREVRSSVTALGVVPGSEQGFGGMQDVQTKAHLTIAALKSNQVYLNQTAAQELNAKVGDALYVYSSRWPGQRYSLQVAAIVGNNGLVGDNPAILSQAQTFQDIENTPDEINQIFIANRGGANSVALSDPVSGEVRNWLRSLYGFRRFHRDAPPPAGNHTAGQMAMVRMNPFALGNLHVIPVKEQGVQDSLLAGDIFSRIFSLFALFALAIGLLLIFLIFVLLAAERRAEMGMARAIGVQRRHLILMFLFEGSVYDLISSFIGLLAGVGIGAVLIIFLGPILARFNFPLKFTLQPHSLIVAYCLGVIFTFCSVALSSWLVSRMTIVEAMRDQPEPTRAELSLRELGARFLQLAQQVGKSTASSTSMRQTRRILLEFMPDLLLGFVRELAMLGLLPLLVGGVLMAFGLASALIIPFSLGLSLVLIGAGLLLKTLSLWMVTWIARACRSTVNMVHWRSVADSIFAAVVGLALVAYWALPFEYPGRTRATTLPGWDRGLLCGWCDDGAGSGMGNHGECTFPGKSVAGGMFIS